jgi:acyl-CoA thioester hydrolase
MNLTQPLPKEMQSSYVVRFQDCDPFGHLNNARYIDYFFNARQDQLAEHYDFHIFEHGQETNHNWVVTQTHLAYLYPALVNEKIVVLTRLVKMSESTLVVEAVMFDAAMRRPKAVGWTEFTYVSLLSGRTAKHSDDLMALFRDVIVDGIYEPDGFNRRVTALRQEFRKGPEMTSRQGAAVAQ